MTAPTREQVIQWAQQVGLFGGEIPDEYAVLCGIHKGGCFTLDATNENIAELAALAYAAGQASERSAMPPPPLVIDNPDVAKAVAVAVRTEREACAAHMEAMCNKSRDARFRSALTIAAAAIRARGESTRRAIVRAAAEIGKAMK